MAGKEHSENFFEARTLYENEEVTVALIVLKGTGRTVKNRRSDQSYHIISGEGEFKIFSGKKPGDYGVETHTHVVPGDVVTIPRGRIYQDSGDLVMVAISEPSFDPSMVETF